MKVKVNTDSNYLRDSPFHWNVFFYKQIKFEGISKVLGEDIYINEFLQYNKKEILDNEEEFVVLTKILTVTLAEVLPSSRYLRGLIK